jgi:hypothetical protein
MLFKRHDEYHTSKDQTISLLPEFEQMIKASNIFSSKISHLYIAVKGRSNHLLKFKDPKNQPDVEMEEENK